MPHHDHATQVYDVLGIGQLMVDYAAAVDDDTLAALNVPKGGRRVISVQERAQVMEQLQGCDSQVSTGGSLANSLVGIAQLAAARLRSLDTAAAAAAAGSSAPSSGRPQQLQQQQQRRLRVAMAGCIGGSDALGEFGRAQLDAAGVELLCVDADDGTLPAAAAAGGSSSAAPASAAAAAAAARWSGSSTGTVMVFTTPDAQRSFLSSFSAEDAMRLTPALLSAVARARCVVLEGYLWELPGAADVVPAVVRHARAVGTLVVLTAGDASVVQRHGAKVLAAMRAGVDMLVCNEKEAEALVAHLNAQQQEQQEQEQEQQQQQQQQQAKQQDGGVAAARLQVPAVAQLEHVHLDPQGSASIDGGDDADRRQQLGCDSANNSAASAGAAAAARAGVAAGAAAPLPVVSSSEGQAAACELAGVCPMVVVTDGSRGSYITALGQLVVVPPFWRSQRPVDTCGAGDAYFAGLLFAFLHGMDLHAMGHMAAKTASAVISRHGPQLQPLDADWVAGALHGPAAASSGRILAAGLLGGGAADELRLAPAPSKGGSTDGAAAAVVAASGS
jgi:sugar/nucleoside kinase (ribokinase family)